MKTRLVALQFILFAWSAMAAARASVVYTQPPSPAGGFIPCSFLDPNGMDGDGYAYDSFSLPNNQAITEIDWLGGDNLGGSWGPQAVIDFTISIYGPGPVAYQPPVTAAPLAQFTVGGNANETPAGTIAGRPVRSYKYVLPSPFQIEAGKTYWLEIEASQSFYPNGWGMCVGIGDDGTHFAAITGGSAAGGTLYIANSGGDTAFSLLTADTATVYIAAISSPLTGGTVTGKGSYPIGSTASLTAVANTGYGFYDWTENGAQISTSPNITFTATADRTLMANFVPAHIVSTSSTPVYGGTTSGGGTYNQGMTATVVATPSTGFVFRNWTANGAPVSTSASYPFTVTADRTLVANFDLAPSSVLYDFDTGQPLLTATHFTTPFYQSSRGLTAQFLGTGQGFSVQSDATTQFHMPLFYGNYLYPNSVFTPGLDIQLSQPVTLITFTFATADYNQNEATSPVIATAYMGASITTPIGSATSRGVYIGGNLPMGSLILTTTAPFDLVTVRGGVDFLVDNILVSPGPPAFTATDLIDALRICAGLSAATSVSFARYNIETAGTSATTIDTLDVLRIARKVAGLEANP